MITLIFSFDRAMQLDAALRSFLLHCKDAHQFSLVVLYKASDEIYLRQYARLAQEFKDHQNLRFVQERSFRRDVLVLLQGAAQGSLTRTCYRFLARFGPRAAWLTGLQLPIQPQQPLLFLVDDNLFVRPFELQEVTRALAEHPEALGFSLRLGANTGYCYTRSRPQELPHFSPIENGILKYSWTNAVDDFGYPLEVSSSVYRLDDIYPLLCKIPFSNPNRLEGKLARQAQSFRQRSPYLLCYPQSVTFCNPVNMVQTVIQNRSGTSQEFTKERLAQLFEEGYRINVEAFTGFVPNSCHQEADLVFERAVQS